MSGYLNRLLRRSRLANESQSLKPFVRSTSPVAERDRRLGMAGFENSEFGPSSPVELDSDGDFAGADISQVSPPPSITASGKMAIQRKMAATTQAFPIAPNTIAIKASGQDSLESVKGDRDRTSLPKLPEAAPIEALEPSLSQSKTLGQVDNRQSSTASSSLPRLAEPISNLPRSNREQLPQPTSTAPDLEMPREKNLMATEAKMSVVIPSPKPSQTPKAEQSTSIEILPQFPTLEPSTHRLEIIEDTTVSNINRQESPRVVIGRINIEIISSSPTEATGARSPAETPTAASVSVIGPLGGGVSSNRRLSLRQR